MVSFRERYNVVLTYGSLVWIVFYVFNGLLISPRILKNSSLQYYS